MKNNCTFLKEAFNISNKSNCLRKKVGAVLVSKDKILLKAYNNIPKEIEACSKCGCIRDKEKIKSGEKIERCRVVHAEQQIIIDCALNGINPFGCTLYTTHSPCIICSKMLANAGIKTVYYAIEREDNNTNKLFFNDSQMTIKKLEY